MQTLEQRLRAASQAYYEGTPILSDQEFDALRDELETTDPDNPFLKEVGATVSSALQKVQHAIPMGSLNKCGGSNREKEFQTWARNIPCGCVVQWKLDGISIELVYRSGKFVQAITRGDGIEGEDVTHTIRPCVPLVISEKANVNVRAEAILPISVWESYFSDSFANPRNTVSGLVRRKEVVEWNSHVKLIAYDLIVQGNSLPSEVEKVYLLEELGFQQVESEFVDDVQKVPGLTKRMESKRDSIDFEVDGCVIKTNEVQEQTRLGERDGRPKWAIAWKFEARGAFSILQDVEWSVGSTGRITPVALIKPVKVSGVTISRVTLHNCEEMERLGISIGDEIEVIRAGDVIPKIVRVVHSKGKNRPSVRQCPACGSSVLRDGPYYVCGSALCSGKQFRRMRTWVSKRNIMHLGEQYLKALYDNGVKTIAGLYRLDEQGLTKRGVPSGMALKIWPEIEKSQQVTVADFLGSLSLDMLGRTEAKNLVRLGFNTVDKICNLTTADLVGHSGYQQTKAERIVAGLKDAQKEIRELAALLHIKKEASVRSNSPLVGKSVCFTGAAARPRKELQDLAEKSGAIVKSSVGKDLDFLVMADANSQSAKAQKARSLGVTIISEEDFVSKAQ